MPIQYKFGKVYCCHCGKYFYPKECKLAKDGALLCPKDRKKVRWNPLSGKEKMLLPSRHARKMMYLEGSL